MLAAALAGAAGCGEKPARPTAHEQEALEVTLVRPTYGTVGWTVRQPGSIEAFEETAIVPKVAGYVQSWKVDIGDRVKGGDVLAVLWVPDLVKELEQRRAEVDQARKLFAVAEAHLASVGASVEEARAGLNRSEAGETYRRLQHGRVNKLLDRAVVNKQVEEESLNELRAARAAVEESRARVDRAGADLRESEAVRNKARVDIDVARAALERTEAMVAYATLKAPYDGVVTRRSINTGDYVEPPAGSASDPVYVVQRRDLVRVFVEVPEADAVWVREGASVRIEVPSLPGRDFRGTVRRSSYSLKARSRTLLAEVDLPNPDDLLRPGMYAYASVRIERPHVLTLPAPALAREGDVNEGYQDYCYLLDGGKLQRTPVELGSRGDGRVQVLKKQVRDAWVDFTGDEPVVLGELSDLHDGEPVVVKTSAGTPLARETGADGATEGSRGRRGPSSTAHPPAGG